MRLVELEIYKALISGITGILPTVKDMNVM